MTHFAAVSINPEETKKNVKVDNRSHDSDSNCLPIEFKALGLPILSNIHVALCQPAFAAGSGGTGSTPLLGLSPPLANI